ncbi:alanyl-tRNA editing protein [Natronolimnobius baerhuensis]|uniref:Alanyl-tRNA editing protein n=1 Tax=Natronolimnobius baerhuensis TaxID=253108 RepID=A0A202E8A1_9EURY|nr:alanyl-tRNA editing protein [Natronolimnobius baerhuensis]OVE84467.1 alanyl-tRNA editing protein [Natronolimnobius baerhuensis]
MTGQRAAAEPYTTRFETGVTAVDGRRVWLERSYFYGAIGGQPADQGRIADTEVVDVEYVDGTQVHVLAEEPTLRTGQRVLCSIDWAFRMYCMRAHTASHALYGAARELLEDLEHGGLEFDGEDAVRVTLETTTAVDDETLLALNERLNRVVWESRPVSWDTISLAEARERDDVVFTDATEESAQENGRVRVVTIGSADENGNGSGTSRLSGGFTVGNGGEPWDVAACGGTHVRNTREIGPVTILGRVPTAAGALEIDLAVGQRAIEQRTAEKRAALTATRTLEASVDAVPSALERAYDRDPTGPESYTDD